MGVPGGLTIPCRFVPKGPVPTRFSWARPGTCAGQKPGVSTRSHVRTLAGHRSAVTATLSIARRVLERVLLYRVREPRPAFAGRSATGRFRLPVRSPSWGVPGGLTIPCRFVPRGPVPTRSSGPDPVRVLVRTKRVAPLTITRTITLARITHTLVLVGRQPCRRTNAHSRRLVVHIAKLEAHSFTSVGCRTSPRLRLSPIRTDRLLPIRTERVAPLTSTFTLVLGQVTPALVHVDRESTLPRSRLRTLVPGGERRYTHTHSRRPATHIATPTPFTPAGSPRRRRTCTQARNPYRQDNAHPPRPVDCVITLTPVHAGLLHTSPRQLPFTPISRYTATRPRSLTSTDSPCRCRSAPSPVHARSGILSHLPVAACPSSPRWITSACCSHLHASTRPRRPAATCPTLTHIPVHQQPISERPPSPSPAIHAHPRRQAPPGLSGPRETMS